MKHIKDKLIAGIVIAGLSFILIFISSRCSAQKLDRVNIFPEKDSVVNYTGVIQVDSSINKDQLFIRCRQWFVNAYNSAKDVIQFEDKESGIITGKGTIQTYYKMGMLSGETVTVYHTIKVEVKDGKYKYELTDLNAKYYSSGNSIGTSYIPGHWVEFSPSNYVYRFNKKNQIKMYESIHAQLTAIIESLKVAMNKPVAKQEKW